MNDVDGKRQSPPSAAVTLADVIADALARRGVRRIFGIPGGGSSLALIEAAARADIDFVLARTETAAAIMAAVTGELTDTPGVVLTGVGPGAASVVNGVAYAQLERSPLLVLTDGPASSQHQAFDQNALFAPLAKTTGRLRPTDGAEILETALNLAMAAPRGVAQFDLTAGDAETPATPPTPPPLTTPGEVNANALSTATAMLAASRRPVVLVGLEARAGAAADALRTLVDALGCPVLPTYKASGVIAAAHPGAVGPFTGAAAEADCLRAADLIVCFGLDPIEIIPGGWPYDAPVLDIRSCDGPPLPVAPAGSVIGDLASIVTALGSLERSDWRPSEIAEFRHDMRSRLLVSSGGRSAADVVQAVSEVAPPGCRASVDAGAHMFAACGLWPAEQPFGILKSNGLSTMGYALPAAIASSLAEPAKPIVALSGDGGMMMCLGELNTAVQLGLDLVVVVINDAALSLIDAKQQRQQLPSRGVRYTPVDFASTAAGLGCASWRVGPDDNLRQALASAFAVSGPCLVDVAVDPSGYAEQLANLRG